MDERGIKQNKRSPHPKQSGCFFKHFFFCWQIPIFLKGWTKELTEDDLYAPLKEYESKTLGNKVEKAWFNEKNIENPSLWRILIQTFGLEFIIIGILFLPAEILVLYKQSCSFLFFLLFSNSSIGQPILLSKLLDQFVVMQDKISTEVYVYAGLLTLLSFFRALVFNYIILEMSALGMKMKIACSSLIYRSILKTSAQENTVGKIVNLLSNDVSKFEEAFTFVHYIWIAPIELVLGGVYLDLQLGPMSVVGVGILIFCFIFQAYISTKISKKRKDVAEKTDHRICLLTDVVSGIKVVKMYTWEKSFFEVIQTARNLEMKHINIANYYRLGVTSFKLFSTSLCVFSGVVTLTLSGISLTPQYLYSLESIYESLMVSLINLIPLSLIRLSEVITSVQRIEEFLLKATKSKFLSEEESNLNVKPYNIFDKSLNSIYIRNATARYQTKNILSHITFTALSSDLVGVVGPSGSGKTTLLQVILKEIEANGRGIVYVSGKKSYSSQEPWIFSASIRQNILFGEKFNFRKYQKIIQICALEHDLSLFPQGDATIVGDRGAALSGGQRARINLARAVYKDADIYLLDDPLSALDPNVARHIFKKCILKYLKHRCVILVTHQVQYLQAADKIYFLEEGKIRDCGKFEKIIGLKSHQEDLNMNNYTLDFPKTPTLRKYTVLEDAKEHRSSGRYSMRIYKRYFSSAGHCLFTFIILLCLITCQTLISFCDYFLSIWSELSSEFKKEKVFYFYICLEVSIILAVLFTTWLFIKYCSNASISLHRQLLNKIVHGTMTFFNQHSSGRILNRFTKDMGAIDEILPMTLMNIGTGTLTIIGSLVLVSVTNYWMIITSILLVLMVGLCGIVFQSTNRNLKRTEGIMKSLVFSHVTATVQGLPTIRAANAQKLLSEEFDNYQDLHTSAFYLLTAIYSALGFWMELICTIYVGFVIFGFILIAQNFYISFVGLAITQATTLVGLFQYVVKAWGEVDTDMTSVERVVDYIDLPAEPDQGNFTPPGWPTSGNITFDNVSLQYASEQPCILKNVTFHIPAGEKIGIVGRTGAGKSSLISAIFRLFDFEGRIIIDGVDTKTLPLKLLRSKISIIPQEPTLFVGSLRRNLDPFDEFTDAEIWQVLDKLALKKMVSSLDVHISEGGSNFSLGQKQLLCLVRAVLRSNRIIVLDEATASVDDVTDRLIQDIIRRSLLDCTVLTIAHRLNTILDSDKILVMDDGLIKKFDTPQNLLQDGESIFSQYLNRN